MGTAHAKVATSLAGVAVAGVTSRTARSSEALALQVGARPYTDWRAMVETEACDAIVVAVSHEVSEALYAEVVGAGIPLLLEKPVATDAAALARLAEAAKAAGTRVMVGVNRRFYSTLQQARMELLRQGPIRGVLVEVHEPMYRYRSRVDLPAAIYDDWLVQNSIHVLDLLTMLGGGARVDYAEVRSLRGPGPADLVAQLTLDSGISASIVGYFNCGGGVGVRIYADGVTASLVPTEEATLSYATGRRIVLLPNAVDRRFKPGLHGQMAAFLGAVRDGVEPGHPAADLAEHGRTLALLDDLRARAESVAHQ